MVPTKYGVQPAKAILFKKKMTAARASREIQVDQKHLTNALTGRVRPRPEVRERLPLLLNVPLEQLFTEQALDPFGWLAGGVR
jgi:transcriptional regulator with XRE-family HTH domain